MLEHLPWILKFCSRAEDTDKNNPNSNCFFGDSINKPTALIVINRQVLDSCTSQVCLIVWSSFMPGGTSLADWQVEVLIYNRKQLLSRLC